MGLIIAVGTASIGAVVSYNHLRAVDPAGAAETIGRLRQAANVLLALVRATVALLDALTATRSAGVGFGSPLRMGRPVGEEYA
jgi:hypothetical protein